MDTKNLLEKLRKLVEQAKKERNRLGKEGLRVRAASLVKQVEENLPMIEESLSQRYPELKNRVMYSMDSDLRCLGYRLERFNRDDSVVAARWQSCLVGEFFGDRIWPQDSRHALIEIGKDFFAAIVRDDFRSVRKLYLQILGIKTAMRQKLHVSG